MASLYKRSGRYYAQFHDADRSPKQKQLSLKTSDKDTALELYVEWRRLYRTGRADPWEDNMHKAVQPDHREVVPLEAAKTRFVEEKRAAGRAKSTLRSYDGILGRLVERVGTESDIAALTANDIREFVYRGEVSASTKSKRFRHVRAFLNWAEKNELLGDRQPMGKIESPKTEKKLPVAAREQEVVHITAAMENVSIDRFQKGQIEKGQIVWRIYPIWFSYYTGLRRSEIARLRWKDVNISEATLHLRTQKNKQEAIISLSKPAIAILKALRPNMTGPWIRMSALAEDKNYVDNKHERLRWDPPEVDWFVFRAPGSSETERTFEHWCNDMSRAFTKYRKKIGLRDGLTFHSLRAGFCTRLAESGANAATIKKLARHSSIQTSMKYIEMTEQHGRRAMDKAFGDSPPIGIKKMPRELRRGR